MDHRTHLWCLLDRTAVDAVVHIDPTVCVWLCSLLVFLSLPAKRITGNVEYKVEQSTVPLGGTINGFIAFTPRRSSKIDGVTWTLSCHEKCSSGSGSKRQSHTHEAFKEVTQLLLT